jgi:hypothetical protein
MRRVSPNEHRTPVHRVVARRAHAERTCVCCGAPNIAETGSRCTRCLESTEDDVDPYLELGCGD